MIRDNYPSSGRMVWMIAVILLGVAWSGHCMAEDAALPADASGSAVDVKAVEGGHSIDAGDLVTNRIDAIRQRFSDLAAAVPRVPVELRQAVDTLGTELPETGLIRVTIRIAALLAPAIAAELLCRRHMSRLRPPLGARRSPRLYDRLRSVVFPLTIELAPILAFTILAAIMVLLFDWPPLLRRLVVGYLIATIVLRTALAFDRACLAPHLTDDQVAQEQRIVPLDREGASFWHRHVAWFVGWFAFGWITVDLLTRLGVSIDVRRLVAFTLALGLLAVAM